QFGHSVAIDGDTMVVGAPTADLDALGQPLKAIKGTAYVFVRQGTSWVYQATLLPEAPETLESLDVFGYSVAIYKNTIVVGAPGRGISQGNGDPSLKNVGQGAAYVFYRDSGQWKQQAKLVANDGKAGDAFGSSVAIHGGVVVVGVPAFWPNIDYISNF